MRIEIVAGSPRQASVTHRVALHLGQQLSQTTAHSIGLLDVREHPLPFLQAVFPSEAETPEAFKTLARRMFAADAFILVTPEYNGSYTPALQNMFDHFPKQGRKPFGIVTASPGALGGIRAAMQTQQFIMALFGIPSPYMLVTPAVEKKFDSEGKLLDETFKKSIDTFLREYLWLAESIVPAKVAGG